MEAELKGTTKDPPERWLVTVCILYASGSTGLIYLNSVYSEALKAKHSLTQSDVETISAVMFSAGMLSTLPGALVDRIGPRLGVRLGGTIMTTCFLLEFCVCIDVFGGSPKPGLVVGALSTLGGASSMGPGDSSEEPAASIRTSIQEPAASSQEAGDRSDEPAASN